MATALIPQIDIAPLFTEDLPARAAVDAAIFAVAQEIGFLTITGMPAPSAIDHTAKASLTRLFSLPEAKQRPLWKNNFEPSNPNLYRGWFPLHSGPTLSREGYEIGPDIVRALPDHSDDLLYQPTPLPDEADLPGFKAVAGAYFLAMESIGLALLASLSRSLGIPETVFSSVFEDGISTLRLLRYLPRHDLPISDALKATRGEHVDSGLLTLLAPVSGGLGLQAKNSLDEWVDVPAEEGSLAVNFGGLLQRWTGGKIKATEHGVIPVDRERFSIPFFFEPRPNARIEPLPLPGIESFEPFLFGDHLWATTTRFAENFGLLHLRPHKGLYRDPLASNPSATFL